MMTTHDLTPREKTALAAIQYVLHRAQTDPDLGYQLGPYQESFDRLCTAEAELTGQAPFVVQKQRSKCMIPKHQRQKSRQEIYKARADKLESRAEKLQEKLRRLGVEVVFDDDLDDEDPEEEEESDDELEAANARIVAQEAEIARLRRDLQEALGQQCIPYVGDKVADATVGAVGQ